MHRFAALLLISASAAFSNPSDPFEKSGNSTPVIEKLTPAQEAAILSDLKVPDGFDVTLFATSSAANYPVYVAASPSGDLYVSSDGNGSLGTDPGRGRILRLRDSDHDGRADQVTEFVKNVDAPRGLVWDHDRLYLVHPPNVSVYIDSDGDGIADEEKTLIKGIAFDYKGRPADHTTNGLSLGIDGWLYIAAGDFGFMDAVATDGRTLQHRGGGVIRFRPDGSNMEIFSTGTRNILSTPISPLLDLFARDNTNDGGGWDVRLHHFTGLEDHGYPRMYMNFSDEIVKPLADYGGGSGCGGVYLSEPGFPEKWNNAPLTCDWGSGALWHHTVKPDGATFQETAKPQPLIQMTRPTDADVDAMSHIYQASWKGATFKWQGPDVGYIARVSPKAYTPDPLPDFNNATDAELVHLLESPSQVRTLEAQRALLRRPENPTMQASLLALTSDSANPLPARVAALYALTQRATRSESAPAIIASVKPLAADNSITRFVLRALADAGLDSFSKGTTTAPEDIYATALTSSDPRTRLEAIVGATRQNMKPLAPRIAAQLGNADPVIAHTAFRSLSMLGAASACFELLDSPESSPAARTGALRALMRIHSKEVVDGIIERLAKTNEPTARQGLLSALCRLHFHEGPWKGDSWGTRPDTRGPYYQPEAWTETPRISAFLENEFENASADLAPFLAAELIRNRIENREALDRIIALSTESGKVMPELIQQLSETSSIPAAAIPLLIQAARSAADPTTTALAVSTLAKTDSQEGCIASLTALRKLPRMKGGTKPARTAHKAFLASPKLENHHQILETIAADPANENSIWADAALLTLSARQQGSPESREMAQKAITHGWSDPQRRIQILTAIRISEFHDMDEQVLTALDDPNPQVAKAAAQTVKALQIEKATPDTTPLVSSMKPDEVIAAIMQTKGSVSVGRQLFTRQTCASCHAVSMDEPQKGPFLGTIAQTYTRDVLAENIIDPGKTIAQGFATEIFTLKDGTSHMGFVTLESPAEVKIRNIAAQEFVLNTQDIATRTKLPNSLMPPGLASNLTIREFSSLLDYLESLAKK